MQVVYNKGNNTCYLLSTSFVRANFFIKICLEVSVTIHEARRTEVSYSFYSLCMKNGYEGRMKQPRDFIRKQMKLFTSF
jgi:hypothetical protein